MDAPDTNHRTAQQQTLLVSGWVKLALAGSPVEIVRGMLVVSRDGHELGKVAAVVVDDLNHEVTHILLGHLPQTPDYRLASVDSVKRVTRGIVTLCILSQDADNLAVHQPI